MKTSFIFFPVQSAYIALQNQNNTNIQSQAKHNVKPKYTLIIRYKIIAYTYEHNVSFRISHCIDMKSMVECVNYYVSDCIAI